MLVTNLGNPMLFPIISEQRQGVALCHIVVWSALLCSHGCTLHSIKCQNVISSSFIAQFYTLTEQVHGSIISSRYIFVAVLVLALF